MDNVLSTLGERAEPNDVIYFAASLDNPPPNSARVSPSTTPAPTCAFDGYPQIEQALVRVPLDIGLYRTRSLKQKNLLQKNPSHLPRKVWGRKAVPIGGMS